MQRIAGIVLSEATELLFSRELRPSCSGLCVERAGRPGADLRRPPAPFRPVAEIAILSPEEYGKTLILVL